MCANLPTFAGNNRCERAEESGMQHMILQNLPQVVDELYPSRAAAARDLGIEPSRFSRFLSGERSMRSCIGQIVQGLTARSVDFYVRPQSPLALVSEAQPVTARFAYDPSNPARMVAQLEDWFGDLPPDSPLRRRLVRGVMRLLFDELFAVQSPSDQWRFAMASLDGFGARGSDRAIAG
jgi:hypothetical protein